MVTAISQIHISVYAILILETNIEHGYSGIYSAFRDWLFQRWRDVKPLFTSVRLNYTGKHLALAGVEWDFHTQI